MDPGEISATPDELYAHQDSMKSAAADAKSEFKSVDDALRELETQFRGSAATAFAGRYVKWKGGADGTVESLKGLAGFLKGAADAFVNTDSSLSESLEGRGASTSALIGARVEDLRGVAKDLRKLADTIDGDAKSLLAKLGLSQSEIGGARSYDAVGTFQKHWSDARKSIVESSNSAEQFLTAAAGAYESLDQQLREALTGDGSG